MKLLALGLVQVGLSLYLWVLLSVVGQQDPNSWLTMTLGTLVATPVTGVLASYGRFRRDGFRSLLKSALVALAVGYPVLGAVGYMCAVLTFGPDGSYAGWGLAVWGPAYGIAFPIGIGLLSFRSRRSQ